MRSKAESQSKFRHYLENPRKILHKARDFYVKSMEDCANKLSYGGVVGCPGPQVWRLPRSFSVNYSKSRNDERFKELLAAMNKKFGSGVDLNERRQQKMEKGAMRRSYSTSVWLLLGRIDEDKPCYFEDDMIYARSRSYAAKRNLIWVFLVKYISDITLYLSYGHTMYIKVLKIQNHMYLCFLFFI